MASINTDPKKIEDLLARGVNEVIDREHLKQRLLSGEKLRIKLGIDPTSSNLHLGRSVVLLKLRNFQELGHQAVLIVGDFTGVIGDTSDKDSERPMLSEKEVASNMKSYAKQASKILDIKKAEVRYNSKWLKKLGYAEIGKQADQFSLADFIARENIKRRLDAGKRVSLRELLYPLMQGYDSVAVKADVELGGTDQRFNLLAGRRLQEKRGQNPQDILMTNLIPGTDGRKMSSSVGNTINVLDKPREMFGKVMSMPDDVVISYFEHCTRVPMEEIKKFRIKMEQGGSAPRDVKMELAHEITKIYWGEDGARDGKEYFISVFRQKKTPGDMPEFRLSGKNIIEVLTGCGFAESRGEARRLIEQKGVEINGETVDSPEEIVLSGSVVQKGKRFFAKII